MEFRRFTMTFFFDIASAPFDKQTETIIGSISGVNPTATAIEKKNASPQLCLVKPLIRKTSGTITRDELDHQKREPVHAFIETRLHFGPCHAAGQPTEIGLFSCRGNHSRGAAALHACPEKAYIC